MTTITTRTDAVNYIEDLLGSEGTRDEAVAIVYMEGWREVQRRAESGEGWTDAEWLKLLNDAAEVKASEAEYDAGGAK